MKKTIFLSIVILEIFHFLNAQNSTKFESEVLYGKAEALQGKVKTLTESATNRTTLIYTFDALGHLIKREGLIQSVLYDPCKKGYFLREDLEHQYEYI